MSTNRRKSKIVCGWSGKGLGKLATGAATGVIKELASIITLGLYRPQERRYQKIRRSPYTRSL